MFLTCGGCGQSVPGGRATCQFCGASLATAVPSASAQSVAGLRSVGGTKARAYEPQNLQTPRWIETAFTACAGAYALFGALNIVMDFASRHGSSPATAIAVGIVQISIGLGLIVRNEFVRTHVNLILWLSVAVNGLFLFFMLMAALGAGGMLYVAVIFQAFNVALSVAIIWLNNETD